MKQVNISVRLAEYREEQYRPIRVETGRLSPLQGRALQRILNGEKGTELSNGRLVQTAADVVRLLLERAELAAQNGEEAL